MSNSTLEPFDMSGKRCIVTGGGLLPGQRHPRQRARAGRGFHRDQIVRISPAVSLSFGIDETTKLAYPVITHTHYM